MEIREHPKTLTWYMTHFPAVAAEEETGVHGWQNKTAAWMDHRWFAARCSCSGPGGAEEEIQNEKQNNVL